MGGSGITAAWSASNVWAAGEENDGGQALYRVYLDDGETAPGVGVRVTLRGLAAWLAENGRTSYQIRCYSNNDAADSFHQITLRHGPSPDSPVLCAMIPQPLGGGGHPTDPAPHSGTGQARARADSPATLAADVVTITIPPRSGSTRGTLAAIRVTAHGHASLPGRLTRDRWTDIGGSRVADLTGSRLRFHGAPCETAVIAPEDGVSSANGGLFTATRHRGFLTAPETGWYHFWISADDEAELWLADGSVRLPADPALPESPANPVLPYTNRFGKQRIARVVDARAGDSWTDPADFDLFPSQRSRAVHLQAGGSHYLEILHKQGDGPDHLSIAWQPPGRARSLVPADAFTSDRVHPNDLDHDFLPDHWEEIHGLDPADNGIADPAEGQYGDADNDGLTNLEEFQLGTHPLLADTDGDGITDHDEIRLHRTDPLVSNNLLFGPATAFDPHSYATATFRLIREEDGTLTAMERRGEITYPFTVSADPADAGALQPGVLELTLTASAAGIPRATENLPLTLSLDGEPFAAAVITSRNGSPASASVLTPWLTPGVHILSIRHDNFRAELALRLHAVSLRNAGGRDLDENGLPDWLDQRLAAENHILRCPAASLTSPVCVEASSPWPPGASVTAAGEPITIPSVDSTFYADVPLDPSGAPTPVSFSFQSGALVENRNIRWSVSDLSVLDEIHVRQGDSLRLDASSDGWPPDSYSVTMDGVILPNNAGGDVHEPGHPFPAAFPDPGVRRLAVNYHGAGPARTVTVTVHAADLGPAVAARAHFTREWLPPLIGPDVLIQPDRSIALRETTVPPPGAGAPPPRSFRLNSTLTGTHHVIARLPDDVTGAPGAILARSSVNTFHLAYLDETGDISVTFAYPDGATLMRGSIVAVGLPPGVAIRLNTYYQGTIFSNGSNTLLLTNADFDQNGIADVWFEWAGQGDPYVCTFVDLFTIQPPPSNP